MDVQELGNFPSIGVAIPVPVSEWGPGHIGFGQQYGRRVILHRRLECVQEGLET